MNETEVSQSNIREKLISIKSLVRSLELRLMGQVWSGKGDSYIYKGSALCGSDLINKAVALLQPFSEEGNLITSKFDRTFYKQKWRVSHVFNDACMVDNTVYANNYRTVIEMFRDTLQNIGDIILSSRGEVRGILNGAEEQKQDMEY